MSVDLSIIVPVYNEEDNVLPMYEAIRDAVAPIERTIELVFVDDGSRDRTVEHLSALPRQGKPAVRIVKFRRNYGQTQAMMAGIDVARGKVLVTMDGDLQNDPRDIPRFLEQIEAGHDLVVGWRKDRKDHWSRVLPSKVANRLIGWVTGVPIKDNGCSLKAYRADLIKRIPLYSEMHRFIPAMSSLARPKIAEIVVRHHPRMHGSSKYGFSRIYKVFVDLISIRTVLTFARSPLMWLSGLTMLTLLLTLLAAVSAVVFADTSYAGSSVVFAGVTLLFGALTLFLIFLAFLGQLIWGARSKSLAPFVDLAVRPAGREVQ
jgi:glycosyltransferase involved in cell wall biosynthesis